MPLYVTARKVHRIVVPIILFLGLVMAVTGTQMKYLIGDTGMARYIHNNVSVLFTIALVAMMITGACLYFYPWLMKRRQAIQGQQAAHGHDPNKKQLFIKGKQE